MSYGQDIWCADGLVTSRFSRGVTTVVLALYRRTITKRGSLRGGEKEQAYGFDVSSYIGAVGTETAVAALPGILRAEFMKDDRVATVTVSAVVSTDTQGLTTIFLSVDGTLHEDDAPFEFTIAASGVTTALVGGMA